MCSFTYQLPPKNLRRHNLNSLAALDFGAKAPPAQTDSPAL